jgi:hypothetical protein
MSQYRRIRYEDRCQIYALSKRETSGLVIFPQGLKKRRGLAKLTSGLHKAGSMWRSSSICSHAAWSAGR